MIKYKAGLHKDVAKIFDNVRIPQTDDTQSAVSTAYKDISPFSRPRHLVLNNLPEKAKKTKKSRHLSSPWNIFSSKARRERKRLSEISRHLLINLPDKPRSS